MSINRFNTGPRMSQAVVHNGTVYLAGQVAKGATVKEQTTAILKQIDDLLKQAGTDKSKLLSATIWLTSIANYNDMNSVWDAWVSPGNTPARACVEAKLAFPEYAVEIAVVAAV
jgi:enamine deaminase RidA (YjgF/YER057c/UK114 family)